MTDSGALRFDLNAANVKQLTAGNPVHISEAPDEVFESFMKAQEKMLELKYSQKIDTSQNATYDSYANVVVNGEVVAKIDNHGWVESSNAMGGKIQKGLPMEGANGEISGPALAEARANYIADMLGGMVDMSATALSQREFNAIPQPTLSVDHTAMVADPAYQNLQDIYSRRTAFFAQQIAQNPDNVDEILLETPIAESSLTVDDESADTTKSATEEFLDYMAMTPEERFFDAFLKRHNMTQEEFDAQPPEDKEDLLKEFEEELKQSAVISEDEKQRREKA